MKLQLIPGVLIITTQDNSVIEVRGKPGYEGRDYDPGDALHQLLDRLDPPSVAVLMTGVEYHPNRKNPRTKVSFDVLEDFIRSNP